MKTRLYFTQMKDKVQLVLFSFFYSRKTYRNIYEYMHWRSHVHTSRQTLQEFCIVLLLKNHLLTINFSWIWACGIIILFSRPTYMRIVPRQVDWQTSSLKNHVLTIKFSWICWGEPCNTLSMVHTGERQSSLYCIILFSLQSNFLEFVGENPGGGQFIRYDGGTYRKGI